MVKHDLAKIEAGVRFSLTAQNLSKRQREKSLFTYSQMWKNVFNKFIKDMSLTEKPYFKKGRRQNKLILKGHLYFKEI